MWGNQYRDPSLFVIPRFSCSKYVLRNLCFLGLLSWCHPIRVHQLYAGLLGRIEISAILIDSNPINYNLGCVLSWISDHRPIFFMHKYVSLNWIPNHKHMRYRLINDSTKNKSANSLLNYNFDELLTEINIGKFITNFQNTFLHYYNSSCLIKSRNIFRNENKSFQTLDWLINKEWNVVKINICIGNVAKCQK